MRSVTSEESQIVRYEYQTKTIYGETGMNLQYDKSSAGQDPVAKTIEGSVPSLGMGRDQVAVFRLPNGLTLLVRPTHTAPMVSVQLWYYVGSKDEHDGERGIAHLIEHMIFKGTKKLSESDINTVVHMLSGNMNAFTSYDYTGYLFNMPSHNWKQVFPIMADCMENCAFKEDMLSSEMKAVVQELKMYRDKYLSSLMEEQIGFIFSDHPYHHPIIGYKQDLWSVKAKNLSAFYKKHYKPNNAVLAVVGDVDPQEVYEQAVEHFDNIKPDLSYAKEEFYHNRDISSKAVTLYRDIQQPRLMYSFVVSGSRAKKDHIISLIKLALGEGNSSRLYKKLVEDLQLATSVGCSPVELFDHGLFFIVVEPKDIQSINAIEKAIKEELLLLAEEGITDEELARAVKQSKIELCSLLESNESQAYEIAKYFLATGDPNYIFNYLNFPLDQLKKEVHELINRYMRPTVMHKGVILPLPAAERKEWEILQQESDKTDEFILSSHSRTTPVEPPCYAKTVKPGQRNVFNFPKAQSSTLSNGMKVLYHNVENTQKVSIVASLSALSCYDSVELPGLYNFVASMMTEGTEHYTAEEFAHAVESKGMSVSVIPGKIFITLLSEDLPFGLDILNEILTKATFDKKEIEKVRDQLRSQIKSFWDEPTSFGGLLVKQQIYKGHPYSKNLLGTIESIDAITRKDLVNFYNKYISPCGMRVVIVGDLRGYDVVHECEQRLGKCGGKSVEALSFPPLSCTVENEVNYPINRDQVLLYLAGLSVDRKHDDFDKLLLFDQIFGGGVLGSMNSRLFDLREQSGLFYTINGSFVVGADEQPGMMIVRTIVSLDRLAEAEQAIKQTMETAVDSITPQEFAEAKNAVINSLVNNFTSTERMAEAFLFVNRYNFSSDFFDKRAEQLEKITLEEVKEAVHRVLKRNGLLILRVGRVADLKKLVKPEIEK